MRLVFLLSCFFLINISQVIATESLQELIDQTPENGELLLENELYVGNVIIDKPITIRGKNPSVTIQGEGVGNVIEIHASQVTLENLTITSSGYDRNSGEEYAAVKVMEDGNTLRDLIIRDSFHGVYLSQAHHNIIQNIDVIGLSKGDIASQGNGIHSYYSNYNKIENNLIRETRDGMYFDYSNYNEVINNDISHTRYGLHYMYSHNNYFSHNLFRFNTGGAAVMESWKIRLKTMNFR